MCSESKARCYVSSEEIKRVTKEQANGRYLRPRAETEPELPRGENVTQPPVSSDFGAFAEAPEAVAFPQVVDQIEVKETTSVEDREKMYHQNKKGVTSADGPQKPRKNSRAPLTQEEKDQVAILISYGHSLRQAAAQIGRSHVTLHRHLKKDSAFAEQVERYRGYAESDAMTEVVKASKRSWRAAAWLLTYLERRERSHDATKSTSA